MFLTKQEEQRYNKIKEAIGKWHKLLPYSTKPSLNVLAFLAGLRRITKKEFDKIYKEVTNNGYC